MKKYIVLYRASQATMESWGQSTPEEKKKGMEEWNAWAEKCGDSLLDMGTPLGNGQKVSSNGKTGSEMDIVGFSILQAESMEEAEKLLESHPHLGWGEGCDIEVFEEMPMPSQ